LGDEIKEDEIDGSCGMHGINAYNILVGKPEGKRPHGRPRHRWENNIRMDLTEIRWEDVDWIHLAQGRDQCWPLVWFP
jgi:hypothetical protein